MHLGRLRLRNAGQSRLNVVRLRLEDACAYSKGRLSRPRVLAPGFCRPPRRSRKRCCRSWTSPSSSTAWKRRWPRASTTSCWSRAAARTPSRITSTSRWSSRRSSNRAASTSMLNEVRKISNLINFAYVRQGEPLGLGHAVLVTRELVGRRTLRGHPERRRDRRDAAGAEADDRRLRARGRARCSASSACRARRSPATASSPTSRTPRCRRARIA